MYPLQRELLTDPTRLAEDDARAAHAAVAAFLQECYEQDRDRELGLTVEVELLACLEHATAAEDRPRRRWAVTKLCWQLIPHAEYAAARALVAPLLDEERHPDLLQIAARVASDTGDWKTARTLGDEEQQARVALGDRAGEAATWHQLATIDVNEGNYADAREKFAKSLAMRQAIGDRAGEAATLYQIGFVAWQNGRREVAIRLVATCPGASNSRSIGAAEQGRVLQDLVHDGR